MNQVTLVGDKLMGWYNIVPKLSNCQLIDGRDIFRWGLYRQGHFSMRSRSHPSRHRLKDLNLLLWSGNRLDIYLWFWALLQDENNREAICLARKTSEVAALDIFANNGWRSNNIIFSRFPFIFSLI
ncbi:hypothetical protein BS78_06G046700 [Paspalum vaginatum]|nr:hypothetical protein BS78_06G046700 [Paspalum vaginatum]